MESDFPGAASGVRGAPGTAGVVDRHLQGLEEQQFRSVGHAPGPVELSGLPDDQDRGSAGSALSSPTKPTSAAAARRAAREAAAAAVRPVQLAPEIATRIAGYRPKKIDPDVWEAIRPAVMEIVSASAPASPGHAQHRMLPVAKLATWARGEGIALDAVTLLSERVIEEWARRSIADGEPASSIATYRSHLRRVAAAVTPAAGSPTAAIRRTDGAEPYTPEDDLALRRAVTGQRTAVYRYTGCLLYGLSRGAGLSSGDLRSLRVGDVLDTHDGISVDVAGRRVWVLAEFCDIVRTGLSVDRGHEWLLAGRKGQKRNIGEYIDRFAVPAGTPRLNLPRCRATWVLDHVNRGTPVTVIRDALGVDGLHSVERVLKHADSVEDATRARLLRGTP